MLTFHINICMHMRTCTSRMNMHTHVHTSYWSNDNSWPPPRTHLRTGKNRGKTIACILYQLLAVVINTEIFTHFIQHLNIFFFFFFLITCLSPHILFLAFWQVSTGTLPVIRVTSACTLPHQLSRYGLWSDRDIRRRCECAACCRKRVDRLAAYSQRRTGDNLLSTPGKYLI